MIQTTKRLRKLATARSTGTLPFSGPGEGAIVFRDGRVAYAESNRTPGRHPGAEGAGGLASAAAAAEATVDAALELLSSESRYGKFRSAEVHPGDRGPGVSLETLLTEVERRCQVLRQLSAVVTPDTTVVRDPQMSSPRMQVSAPQWSLLIRVRDGAAPRDLAMELGRSVFGTTIEVYRLLVLGLLSAPGHHVQEPAGSQAVSFIRAVRGER